MPGYRPTKASEREAQSMMSTSGEPTLQFQQNIVNDSQATSMGQTTVIGDIRGGGMGVANTIAQNRVAGPMIPKGALIGDT